MVIVESPEAQPKILWSCVYGKKQVLVLLDINYKDKYVCHATLIQKIRVRSLNGLNPMNCPGSSVNKSIISIFKCISLKKEEFLLVRWLTSWSIYEEWGDIWRHYGLAVNQCSSFAGFYSSMIEGHKYTVTEKIQPPSANVLQLF